MSKTHKYKTTLNWTGAGDKGTQSYTSYERSYEITTVGKPIINGSSDTAFRGDANKYNPEELFIASISSCHMLWYLHLCSINKITVIEYKDITEGVMIETPDGSGQFEKVILRPQIRIKEHDLRNLAVELHKEAHVKCFIANSVNFEVTCETTVLH